MAFDPGYMEAALAAALGDDPALVRELRMAFTESAAAQLVALERAHHATEWTRAAYRLRGLAASFDATELMAAAEQAVAASPGDRHALAAVRAAID